MRPFSFKKIKRLKVKKGVFKIGMLSRIEDYKGHLNMIYSFLNYQIKKKKFKVFLLEMEIRFLSKKLITLLLKTI